MTKPELVLITGMSGSGKSVALAALEDAGYYCVDNLPPALLEAFVSLQREGPHHKLAVAIDARSQATLADLPALLRKLTTDNLLLTCIFLDATNEALLKRFSETRRAHPLSALSPSAQDRHALLEAIQLERELLATLREHALVIDSTLMKPAKLLNHIKDLLGAAHHGLTLVFESFAFKRGIPMDADYVFDVRMLSNPHYEPALRHLTGRDAEVINYLAKQADVDHMLHHIKLFLDTWLPELQADHRSYVTVAVGCTGGQHRSVYIVEQLARYFGPTWQAQTRHREL